MKLKTSDLQRLAELFEISPSQLLMPPAAADLVRMLERVQSILDGMQPDVAEQWLAIGESLNTAKQK